MLFSSAIFLFLYLPCFLLIYYIIPHHWRNAFLFVASLFFYAWGETLVVFVLLLSTLINFLAGIIIERGQRRLGLLLSLIGSLSLLVYYKYANFIFYSFKGFAEAFMLPIDNDINLAQVALPIGISFYTFQGISYAVDIYWGRIKANHSFLDYGTYIAMFPHQIAGPIVRYADIAPELQQRSVSVEKFGAGSERFIIGLAKKVLLANTFANVADTVFNSPSTSYSTGTAWIGIIAYTLQIYFDFSGYSDMAIGLGKMVGFDFKENFNYPYAARSVQDFWRRWHISLSSWFRDYLYIPLGGNRGTQWQTYRNLLIVFFMTGLWHGASWNFVIWGLYHGLFLLAERAGLGKKIDRAPGILAHVYTLLVVMIGWVFFRADNLSAAVLYLKKMFGIHSVSSSITLPVNYLVDAELIITLIFGLLFVVPTYKRFHEQISKLQDRLKSYSFQILFDTTYAVGLFVLFIGTVMYLAADTYNPFIYFRF